MNDDKIYLDENKISKKKIQLTFAKKDVLFSITKDFSDNFPTRMKLPTCNLNLNI